MNKVIKIIQFTDSHLFGSSEKRICGLDTFRTFRETFELAKKNAWPPDLIFLTGDNSQDSTAQSYKRLKGLFSNETAPIYCLPGNHDSIPIMKGAFRNSNILIEKTFVRENWQFIFLDSNIEHSPKGNLSKEELKFLDKALCKNSAHALVVLHHQPLPVGSEWLDTMAVRNHNEFFEVLFSHRQVRGILFGHVHQEFVAEMDGKIILGSPSTCFQFKPKQENFSLDDKGPGYRWVNLFPDGKITSAIERLAYVPVDLDLQTKGY